MLNETLKKRLAKDRAVTSITLRIPVDVVDIFRPAAETPEIVRQAIANGAKAVWFQLGIRNDVVAARLVEAGIAVVQDRCLMVDHRQLG